MNPLTPRHARPFTGRSQIALELAILVYAVGTALVLIRLLLLALGIDDRLWIGATFYRFTDPFVDALARLPGADRTFVGDITLPDVTLLALTTLVPLGLIARGRRTVA